MEKLMSMLLLHVCSKKEKKFVHSWVFTNGWAWQKANILTYPVSPPPDKFEAASWNDVVYWAVSRDWPVAYP